MVISAKNLNMHKMHKQSYDLMIELHKWYQFIMGIYIHGQGMPRKE